MRKPSLPICVAFLCAGIALGGCSKESRDWRSAQAADSLEAYDHFLESHPDSALAAQARSRLLQLTEERDWQRAGAADTADAYKQFLNQHPNGKWSAEARIRLENFALEGQPPIFSTNQSDVRVARADAPASTYPKAQATTVAAPNNTGASVADGFGIQLGAFGSEARAHSEWQRLQSAFNSELSTLQPHIVSATTAAGSLFRLQARLGSEAQARAVCASLIEKSQACVVVLPH